MFVRAGHATEAQCFFRSRPDTTCEHKGWTKKSQGNWDTSMGGKKYTLLDGHGQPTENGWRVIDNTGITEQDLVDQHQSGVSYYACTSTAARHHPWRVLYSRRAAILLPEVL